MVEIGQDTLNERYALALERIRLMQKENSAAEPFRDYFSRMAEFVLLMTDIREALGRGLTVRYSLEDWQAQNAVCMRISCRSITMPVMPIRRMPSLFLARSTESRSAFSTRSCAG